MTSAPPKAKPTAKAGRIRIGISGWRYPPWRGVFYPDKLTQARELEYASRALPVIELNGSFYSLQTPERYARWAEDTPAGFMFTVKAPRYITHIRRLDDPLEPMANFMASGLFELGPKLGAILWQFPPGMRFDPEKFETFLALLPHTAAQAKALAKQRSSRMHGKESLEPGARQRFRHAIEVRNDSFVDPAFIDMLRKYKAALVVADTGGRWPEYEDLTADFVYVRLHGANALYESGYAEKQLDDWARRIRSWAKGSQHRGAKLMSTASAPKRAARDVFCFFDNTAKIAAPANAQRLREKLKA
jgi:uncharacterized protein YecE (DUF72 family)